MSAPPKWKKDEWGPIENYCIEWTWKASEYRIQIYYADGGVEQWFLTGTWNKTYIQEYVETKVAMRRLKDDDEGKKIPDLKITINY